MTAQPDEWKPGRYREVRARTLVSGRVGSSGGSAARTFHCRFGAVTVAQGGTARSSAGVDYLAREGDYERRAQDLEHLEGDTDRMRAALDAVDQAAKWRNGRTAERVAIKAEIELPADSSPDQRKAAARALVAMWKRRGHEAVVAVHGNDTVQPHLHLLATARPVTLTEKGWTVDRDPARVPLRGRAAVRAARARVAGVINGHCRPTVRFHPGRLRDTGIERAAKVRLPAAEYHRRTREAKSLTRMVNASIDAGDGLRIEAERRAWVEASKRKAEERKAAEAEARKAKNSAALKSGKGKVPAVTAKILYGEVLKAQKAAATWKDSYDKLTATIAKERTTPGVKPPSEAQRKTAVDMAEKLAVELPEGWDVSVGSAGAAVRLLGALKAAREASTPPARRIDIMPRPKGVEVLLDGGSVGVVTNRLGLAGVLRRFAEDRPIYVSPDLPPTPASWVRQAINDRLEEIARAENQARLDALEPGRLRAENDRLKGELADAQARLDGSSPSALGIRRRMPLPLDPPMEPIVERVVERIVEKPVIQERIIRETGVFLGDRQATPQEIIDRINADQEKLREIEKNRIDNGRVVEALDYVHSLLTKQGVSSKQSKAIFDAVRLRLSLPVEGVVIQSKPRDRGQER